MFLSDTAKNKMLDAMDESVVGGFTHLSLHTAYSNSGANEVTGGSPAYARKAATWNAAASGAKALASAVTFDVPATTVRFIGLWDALTNGNFLGMLPCQGATSSAPTLFAVDDATADTIKAEAHGFSANDKVVAWGSDLPAGLTSGTVYTVATVPNADTLTLQTEAGGALDITSKGEGFLQKIVPETFAAQGTYQVSSLSVNLGAVV